MPIYIGTQKINVSGMEKVYVGNVLVYQKAAAKVVTGITLSGYTTTFNVGNTFSYGGTVIAAYSDGTTADVTSSTTFSGYNMSTAGTQTVTASYTEDGVTVTATYSITVYKVLTKITLSGQTTSLARGATFSFGGTVTATYNDGSTANVTSSTTFSGYNMSVAGTYTVTASYTYRSVTKTATYTLTVTKAWSTIWSGTKSLQMTGTTAATAVAIVNPNVTGSQTFRITFAETTNTYSGGATYNKSYYNNGTRTSTKPSSPIQFTIDTSSDNLRRVGIGRYSSNYSAYQYIDVDYRPYSSSTRPGFYLHNYYQNPMTGVTIKLTVTKIERYY